MPDELNESLPSPNPLTPGATELWKQTHPEPEAIVTDDATELGPKVQGVAPIFRVEAKMYVPAQKYSTGTYRVKILEPIAVVDEYLMDNGKLSFDSAQKLEKGRRFKIEILV